MEQHRQPGGGDLGQPLKERFAPLAEVLEEMDEGRRIFPGGLDGVDSTLNIVVSDDDAASSRNETLPDRRIAEEPWPLNTQEGVSAGPSALQ